MVRLVVMEKKRGLVKVRVAGFGLEFYLERKCTTKKLKSHLNKEIFLLTKSIPSFLP